MFEVSGSLFLEITGHYLLQDASPCLETGNLDWVSPIACHSTGGRTRTDGPQTDGLVIDDSSYDGQVCELAENE